MDQQQTFTWMNEELNRLREENERLRALLPDQPVVEESPTPEQEHMRKMFDEARARVAPLVKEALEAERITPKIMNFRFRSGASQKGDPE